MAQTRAHVCGLCFESLLNSAGFPGAAAPPQRERAARARVTPPPRCADAAPSSRRDSTPVVGHHLSVTAGATSMTASVVGPVAGSARLPRQPQPPGEAGRPFGPTILAPRPWLRLFTHGFQAEASELTWHHLPSRQCCAVGPAGGTRIRSAVCPRGGRPLYASGVLVISALKMDSPALGVNCGTWVGRAEGGKWGGEGGGRTPPARLSDGGSRGERRRARAPRIMRPRKSNAPCAPTRARWRR